MHHFLFASLVVVCVSALPATGYCQSPAERPYQNIGLDLGVSAMHTSEWSIGDADVPGSSGLALEVAYGITPWWAPYVAFDVSVFGQEFSGFTTARVGMLVRLPLSPSPIVPSLRLEFGRLAESGRRSFSFGSIGGGLGVYVSRRWELEVGATWSVPLGTGRRTGSDNILDLDRADFNRVFAGLRWHFGGPRGGLGGRRSLF